MSACVFRRVDTSRSVRRPTLTIEARVCPRVCWPCAVCPRLQRGSPQLKPQSPNSFVHVLCFFLMHMMTQSLLDDDTEIMLSSCLDNSLFIIVQGSDIIRCAFPLSSHAPHSHHRHICHVRLLRWMRTEYCAHLLRSLRHVRTTALAARRRVLE
jgi:hypothetical protein